MRFRAASSNSFEPLRPRSFWKPWKIHFEAKHRGAQGLGLLRNTILIAVTFDVEIAGQLSARSLSYADLFRVQRKPSLSLLLSLHLASALFRQQNCTRISHVRSSLQKKNHLLQDKYIFFSSNSVTFSCSDPVSLTLCQVAFARFVSIRVSKARFSDNQHLFFIVAKSTTLA